MAQQKRGQLTDRIKEKAIELLGYEISREELRLMVYLQYEITNSQKIELTNINEEEFEILMQWHRANYITLFLGENFDVSEVFSSQRFLNGINSQKVKFQITKNFWDIICELIYLGYVDLED